MFYLTNMDNSRRKEEVKMAKLLSLSVSCVEVILVHVELTSTLRMAK